MHVGIDFDNTLITYDELFFRCARERDLIPAAIPAAKGPIRDYLRSLPDGNSVWTRLQAEVYGERILEARPAAGVGRFLTDCRRRGVAVSVISHKTRWPALGPRLDLREAARAWLRDHEALGDGLFLRPDGWPVFFESTREDKVRRIASSGCTHFIDDLEETFLEPAFPGGVRKMLYLPPPNDASRPPPAGCSCWTSWERLRLELFGEAP